MFTDRRKHQRASVEQYCSVECSSEGWSCGGRIKDRSEGGVGLEMLKTPAIRAEMMLYTIEQENSQSVRKAVVAWVRERTSPEVRALVGLQFAQ
jgi:hypothetical protein